MFTLSIDNITQSNAITRQTLSIYILADIRHRLSLKALNVELTLRLRIGNHQQTKSLLRCRIGSKGKVIPLNPLSKGLIEVRETILNIYLILRRDRVEYMYSI